MNENILNDKEYMYECCTCKCSLILEEDRIFEVGEVAKNRVVFCESCFNDTVGENTISLAKDNEEAVKRDREMLKKDLELTSSYSMPSLNPANKSGQVSGVYLCGDPEGKNYLIRMFSNGHFYYKDRLISHGKDVYVTLVNAMHKLGVFD